MKKTKLEGEIGKPYVPKISEDQLQKQVAAYIDLKYPGLLWWHTPNGGSRNFFEACKLKLMGTKPGVPDIMIFKQKMDRETLLVYKITFVKHPGCFVELKVGKNKCTQSQLDMHKKLYENGWVGDVCYTFEAAKQLIDDYLKN